MGNGFFMQNTSQQSFSYVCIIAHFSVISPWTVRKVILISVIFRLIFSELSFVYFAFLSHLIYIYFVLLLFEQSNLIYMLFSFLFLFTVTNLFLLLRFLTLFNLTVARAYRLDFCRLHYRIMFSVLKYLDISCCWM